MSTQVRPPRLVDYFLTVGASDTKSLSPYDLEQQVQEDEYFVISNVCIVSSDRQEDVPPSYHCINETVDGHYGGVNAGGYFNFNKHSGPFIAYKRSNESHEELPLYPITAIVIRDVNEYLRLNPHLLNNSDDDSSDKERKNIKRQAAASLMSQFKKRLSGTRKDKIDLKADDRDEDASLSYKKLPPPTLENSSKKNAQNVSWELIEGNLNKGSLGHHLQIWIERDIDKDPIIDLLIINESKNEEIPYGFNKINVSLNEGASHRDRICLCYKTRARNNTAHDTQRNIGYFTPQIMDRYPAKDYDEFALTSNVAAFCFPRGMEVIGGRKKPKHLKKRLSQHQRSSAADIIAANIDFINNLEDDDDIIEDEHHIDEYDIASYDYTELEIIHKSQQHTFVLSSDTGTRIYGACILFYEEVLDAEQVLMGDDEYISFYVPKAICVLSHYPFYNGFLVFLNHIYCISMSPANNVPIEKYISHFFHSLPLPLCGHPGVEYNIGTKRHIFKLNARYNLRDIHFPLQYLFRCLSIDDIINLIALILLEKQIVLISCSYALITPCAEALRCLIYPFEYQYNFIPVLPQSYARILEAPVPFIFGMHRSFHDELSSQHAITKDIVSVDLDNHVITVNRRRIKHSLFPKRLKGTLRERLNKYVNLQLYNALDTKNTNNTQLPSAIDINENEYFDAQAVRLSFVQCFIDIFRYYRNYLQYSEMNTLKMTFNQDKFLNSLPENLHKFVKEFMKTHSFQRFIDLRCGDLHDNNDAMLNPDLITFDYMISKTLQPVSSSLQLNIQNLNELNRKRSGKKQKSDDASSFSDVTSSSSVKLNGSAIRTKKEEHVELECDLIRQLNELQLEDPYSKYEPFKTESADTNPSDAELASSPYTYDNFPLLQSAFMDEYYRASKRTMIAYDCSTNTINESDSNPNNDLYTKNENGAPNFRAIHYSTEPSLRDKLKSDSMTEQYDVFIMDTMRAVNGYIDELIDEKNERKRKNKKFVHTRIKTKTMKSSVACFTDKIYETWFSIFNHHSINRLSIHTVSPKRDFISSLIVFESMLRSGYHPSELVLRELALIPAHCAMYRELVILDRWMIRLSMMPSLRYLQRIITASARRSHVEYRKFEEYYREKELPLPIRTEFSFHDQDPTDCYPFTHAVDCAPESFFDYFLTNLPAKMLLSGKCLNCKHRLSGEEILAGFQNLKLSQDSYNQQQQQLKHHHKNGSNLIENNNISLMTQTQSTAAARNRSLSDTHNNNNVNKIIHNKKRSSLSISENPHLPTIQLQNVQQKKKNINKKRSSSSNLSGAHRRSGQWTTLCPFCSSETVAKLEIFGAVLAEEYKGELNKFMSMTMMNTNGISLDLRDKKSFRKTFNLFSYERLHERIARILNNAYPYYPTTKLPYSFPKLRAHDNEKAASSTKTQDRAIKIIRSKEELFWNLFFYFKLINLPTEFLFGGMLEFQPRFKYNLAALPHYSWCLVHDNNNNDSKTTATRDGLEKYYSADKILKRIYPTLYASLKPMIADRLYDALILVLQQRGVIQEERILNNNNNNNNNNNDRRKKKMHQFVMNEPLYRLFGKLQNGINGRLSYMIYSKSFTKSCERLSYTHKTRLILPQDKGIQNTLFAHRIQDILLLCKDSYHINDESHDVDVVDDEDKNGIYQMPSSKYDISPLKFHQILTNHTYSQLLQIADRAKEQIAIIQQTAAAQETQEEEDDFERKESDFLFQTNSSDFLIDSAKIKYAQITKTKNVAVSRQRGASETNIINNNNNKSNKIFESPSPSKKFWKVVSDSLSPMKRRRHSVENPCYVPRLRQVLNNEFWMTQYRWYIYYFQPRRMKYIYFILLIQEFYKFKSNETLLLSLPQTFSFYFATKKKIRNIENLDFDLMNMNPETQKKLNCLQYAQFIYYHFVDAHANYKIQFSDPSIVNYIKHSLFVTAANQDQDQEEFKSNLQINTKIFDKMWNAVFRYLHQMTYEPFVIWMNTK